MVGIPEDGCHERILHIVFANLASRRGRLRQVRVEGRARDVLVVLVPGITIAIIDTIGRRSSNFRSKPIVRVRRVLVSMATRISVVAPIDGSVRELPLDHCGWTRACAAAVMRGFVAIGVEAETASESGTRAQSWTSERVVVDKNSRASEIMGIE